MSRIPTTLKLQKISAGEFTFGDSILQALNTLFGIQMFVGGAIGCFLDNTARFGVYVILNFVFQAPQEHNAGSDLIKLEQMRTKQVN